MIKDDNKGITGINYNHLNLPTKITINGREINYIYNALGQKLQKTAPEGTATAIIMSVTDYLSGGFQYKNDVLLFFPTAEGYVNNTDGVFNYVYNYTDHLGNIRVSYGLDPTTNVLRIMEENQYYPFGLKHTNYNSDRLMYIKQAGTLRIKPLPVAQPPEYRFKFSGKELQTELDLNVYDFEARVYSLDIPRTWQIDPLCEKFYDLSPQSFLNNNPLRFTDPTGMSPDDWINFKGKDGQQQIIYDAAIKTKEQAEAKGYTGVQDVFASGTGHSDKSGEQFVFQEDGKFSVNGGKMIDAGEGGVTTASGAYIGENKSTAAVAAPILSNTGDALTVAGAVASATGFGAIAGAPMMAIGQGLSRTGTALSLYDSASTGTLTTEKVVTTVALEAVPMAGGSAVKALGAPAAAKLIDVGAVGVGRAIDATRETKTGAYRQN
jgi:RHS repeat-associated protein